MFTLSPRLLLLHVAALGLLTGCASGLTAQQQRWLAEGRQLYEDKRYSGAIVELSKLLREQPDDPAVARAYYLRGMSHAQMGNRVEAYRDLNAAVDSGADATATREAYVVLGTLHFEDRAWADAAAALREAANRYPSTPPKDVILYRLGLCYERLSRWGESRGPFAEIVKHFPDSNFADAAARRLRVQPEHYAVQVGAFYERENAETLRFQLERDGLTAWLRTEPRNRQTMYVVLVGRFASYDQALGQLAMIQREFVPDAVLWPELSQYR